MATVYGTYSDYRLVDNPTTKLPANADMGRVRVSYDEYTLTADLASGDIIKIGRLPKGARVVNYWMSFADLDGSGGTIDLGWSASSDAVESADPDGFLADVDVTSAGTVGAIEQANMTGLGRAFSAEVDIIATTDGDTDATSGTIKVCVFYVID